MMTEANQEPRQRIMKKNIKSLSKNSLPYYERFSPYSFIRLLIYFNIFLRFRFTSRWLPEMQTASVSFLMSNFVLSLNLVRQDLLFLIPILDGESN